MFLKGYPYGEINAGGGGGGRRQKKGQKWETKQTGKESKGM